MDDVVITDMSVRPTGKSIHIPGMCRPLGYIFLLHAYICMYVCTASPCALKPKFFKPADAKAPPLSADRRVYFFFSKGFATTKCRQAIGTSRQEAGHIGTGGVVGWLYGTSQPHPCLDIETCAIGVKQPSFPTVHTYILAGLTSVY
jgi:hypothetical protein